MIRIALMIAATIGSAILVSEVSEEVKTPPRASQVAQETLPVTQPEGNALSDLGSSLRFVGICSVVCSVIGGTVLITVSRQRERRLRCRE
jgi:uncharacterized membrane protein YeaQ/YmgE (transglycosylase-associated protein family)